MKIKFECTGCGKCCKGPAERASGVNLSRSEAKLLRDAGHGHAVRSTYNQTLLCLVPAPEAGMMQCALLKDNKCTAYEVRPMQCRSFPFWATFFAEPGAWRKAECEGLTVEQ